MFLGYCPQGLMDMSKANKLVKECKGLIDPQNLTMKNVEMIFAKVMPSTRSRLISLSVCLSVSICLALQVKGASGRGLDYSQSLEFFYYLACMKFYGIDASTIVSLAPTRASTPPRPTSSTSRPDTSSRKNRMDMIQKNHDTIQSARFGRFRGKNAVLMRFVYE
jgi:hypothetical protein